MKSRIKCSQSIVLAVWLSVLSLILLPGIAAAAELGRLFSTPGERLHLNQKRNTGEMATASTPAVTESFSRVSPVNVPIRFNGFVKRSSGHTDAWINGRHAGSDQALKRKLGSGNTIRVKVPDSGRSVRMKAGQVLDPATGDVHDVYEGLKAGNKSRVDK